MPLNPNVDLFCCHCFVFVIIVDCLMTMMVWWWVVATILLPYI